MNIDYVCANYGSRKDGIGHFAFNMANAIKSKLAKSDSLRVLTDNISESKFVRVISLRMTWQLLRAAFNRKKVVIEYPFTEYSPLIILPLFIMALHKREQIYISLHEYFRSTKGRKVVINVFISLFKNFLVTDEETRDYLAKKGKKVRIRQIPSNILNIEDAGYIRKNNRYVYFGLINHSKAITELVNAWYSFNNERYNELHIVTSSDTEGIEEKCGLHIIHNAPDDLVDKELKEATFIMLPIRPLVHSNNASFMAGVARYCIPVGVFSKDIEDFSFISAKSNSEGDILEALQISANIPVGEIAERIERISEISQNLPSFNKSAEVYISMMKE